MVASEFIRTLIKEEEHILKDVQTMSVDGKPLVGVKGYEQFLPIVAEDDEDASRYFPYFIVRTDGGVTQDDDDPWTVTVNIIFGCHDKELANNGHRHILTMIERTIDRFAAEPLMDGKYRAQQNMEWALQDEDTYPFFFGGVAIKFSVPKIGRREPAYGEKEYI